MSWHRGGPQARRARVNESCEEIGARPPSRAELIELAASLAVLAGRIYEFDHIVRGRIRALDGETMSVNSIGISGIYAAEAELAATEPNITNASNPNYSVESVNLAARPNEDGASAGVEVLQTVRARAPFLSDETNNTQSPQNFNQSLLQVATLAQQIPTAASRPRRCRRSQRRRNRSSRRSSAPPTCSTRVHMCSAGTRS
jgi:hypothetical protein